MLAPTPSSLPHALNAELFHLDAFETGALRVYRRVPDPIVDAVPVLLVHSINAAASSYEVKPLFDALSASRPTYALDLPGFGGSARPPRRYTPRLMSDAVWATMASIRQRSSTTTIDLVGVSTGCEVVARVAFEHAEDVRTVSMISPTGLDRRGPRRGPAGSTLGRPWVHATLTPVGPPLFRLLTRPGVIRYFLNRTFGHRGIDEGLQAYAVRTAAVQGAEHAPISFLSGALFSADITTIYEGLTMPVWVAHGTRGDFTDYCGLPPLARARGFEVHVYEAGALPYFERPEVAVDLERFLTRAGSVKRA